MSELNIIALQKAARAGRSACDNLRADGRMSLLVGMGIRCGLAMKTAFSSSTGNGARLGDVARNHRTSLSVNRPAATHPEHYHVDAHVGVPGMH